MPNDDLGTFPMPPQTPASTPEPVAADTAIAPPQPDPITPPITSEAPIEPSPIIPSSALPSEPQTTPFEETPEEIPSMQPSPHLITEQERLVTANEELIQKQSSPEIIPPQPLPEPPIPQQPATLPVKTGRSIAPIIIVVLLIIAGLGLASAAYLSAQTAKLKTQLNEISQTLEKQETTLTPTPTTTVFEVPTPTMAPNATESSLATPSASPTISTTNTLQPLANAASALKIAINHSPNAQLILIKVDNATDPTIAVTKYFFREDLKTKKYFYVAITGKNIPEIIDKQIYVTPDDNIPSLNDTVLTNSLGLELDETIKIAYAQCANQTLCLAAPIKAQYIKTGTGIIWQLSLYTKGLTATPLMIQVNAETKAILYKSPEFANK
jgi:hypothetical protein